MLKQSYDYTNHNNIHEYLFASFRISHMHLNIHRKSPSIFKKCTYIKMTSVQDAQASPRNNISLIYSRRVKHKNTYSLKSVHATVGVTSTMVKRWLLWSMTWDLPVGCRYVRGGYRISASVGKADSHCRSAPRCSWFLVTILKIRELLLMLYDTAVAMSVVVDMGASCIYVYICMYAMSPAASCDCAYVVSHVTFNMEASRCSWLEMNVYVKECQITPLGTTTEPTLLQPLLAMMMMMMMVIVMSAQQ
jgi:hypothetical protein